MDEPPCGLPTSSITVQSSLAKIKGLQRGVGLLLCISSLREGDPSIFSSSELATSLHLRKALDERGIGNSQKRRGKSNSAEKKQRDLFVWVCRQGIARCSSDGSSSNLKT